MNRFAIALVIVACAVMVVGAQQVRDGAAPPRVATATVSGVVLQTDDAPGRKARVTLTSSNRAVEGQTTTADDEGRFTFTNVPAGHFTVQANKGGYLTATYGATRPGRPGISVAVSEGARVAGLTLRLERGASISGTVRDARGRPVAGFTVSALRLGFGLFGESQLGHDSPGSQTVTDDRGVYRVWGMRPGEYTVMTKPTAGITEGFSTSGTPFELPPASGSGSVVFAPVFYPGTADVTSAKFITLGLGEDRDGIDLVTEYLPTASIIGSVRMPDGSAPRSVNITTQPAGESQALLASLAIRLPVPTEVGPDGRFVIRGLTPGSYSVVAKTGGRPGIPGTAAPAVLFAQADVLAAGRDVELALEMRPAMTIRGRLAFDGAGPPPSIPAGGEVFLLPPGSGGNLSLGGRGSLDANGAFTITSLVPGDYRAMYAFNLSSSGWTLARSMANGRDVSETPIRVSAGEDVEWVLTYTDRPTEISGVLQPAANTVASDYFIVLFSTDRQHWGPGMQYSRRVTHQRPASDSSFAFRGLRPGEYYLAALTDLDVEDLSRPAFMDTLVAQAIKLTIAEGQQLKQDLRVGR